MLCPIHAIPPVPMHPPVHPNHAPRPCRTDGASSEEMEKLRAQLKETEGLMKGMGRCGNFDIIMEH